MTFVRNSSSGGGGGGSISGGDSGSSGGDSGSSGGDSGSEIVESEIVVVVVMVVCSEPCPPLEKFNTLVQYWFRSIATLHTNVVVIYVTDHAPAARQLCKYLCNGPY